MKNVALILISFTLVFASCETEEGKGGTSTIRGTVTVWEYNKDLTIKLGEYSARKWMFILSMATTQFMAIGSEQDTMENMSLTTYKRVTIPFMHFLKTPLILLQMS
jgi:hypothetical protein